ncbi:MAG: hypothetical protein IJR58_01265, partial [Lachnospiraceae bacterium]|nr:hypothetical protein [Lachnospiraceae bacterium]
TMILFCALFFVFLIYTAFRANLSAKDLRGTSSETDVLGKQREKEGLSYAQLTDEEGNPLYDNDGNLLYVDEEGNVFMIDKDGHRKLVDWDGNAIFDEESRRMCVDPYGNYYVLDDSGRMELKDEYGKSIFSADGRKTYLDSYGNAYVLEDDGMEVLLASDGTIVTDLNGNRILLTGLASDKLYATGQAYRTHMKLAADATHEAIYGTSAAFGESYKSALHAAAMRTRQALHQAADATGAYVRDAYGNLRDSAGNLVDEAASGAEGAVNVAGEAAAESANTWWSFLVNDWNKLKKDITTPLSEFENGNKPNALEDEHYELFHWGD